MGPLYNRQTSHILHLSSSPRRHCEAGTSRPDRPTTPQHRRIECRSRRRPRTVCERTVAVPRFLFKEIVTNRAKIQHVRPRTARRVFGHMIEGRKTTPYTGHRPLTYMFTLKAEKTIDRQVSQISYLSQYLHDVVHTHIYNIIIYICGRTHSGR